MKKIIKNIIFLAISTLLLSGSTVQATTVGYIDPSIPKNMPSVSVYRPNNRSSNIIFSKLPETANALTPPQTLQFHYSFTNPNPTTTYRIERTFYSPLGVAISRVAVTKKLGPNEIYATDAKQYLSTSLLSGLFSIEIKITSANQKKTHDYNSFDLLIVRKK